MRILPIVEVWWRDAEADNGWVEVSESRGNKCPLVRTVGLLLEKTKDMILIASTHSEDQTNSRIRIPAKWVESYKVIQQGNDKEFCVYEGQTEKRKTR